MSGPLEPRVRIELTSPTYEIGILPLNYRGERKVAEDVGVEPNASRHDPVSNRSPVHTGLIFLETPVGFEPTLEGFAIPRLTTWLRGPGGRRRSRTPDIFQPTGIRSQPEDPAPRFTCHNERQGWDSNPGDLSVYTLSKRAP